MTGAPSAPPIESGTPKKGVDCRGCDDWGTVVVETGTERGLQPRESLCPRRCAAAQRVQGQPAREWS